jgi:putative ABC transport system substrate-binding protein
MRRRQFIAIIGGAATWPFAARAQQSAPVIGFMSTRSWNDSAYVVAAFRRGLSDEGFVEGRNVSVEFRWAEGRYAEMPTIAAELVSQQVTVLVAVGGEPSALAAKAATSAIPIVFTAGGDPVQSGLVVSLNRPGGNATGISLLTTAPEAKRLGLLHELVPSAALIGVLINPNYPEAEVQWREVQEAARIIDQRIQISKAGNDEELDGAFAAFVQQRVDALLVCSDPFFDTRRDRLIASAAQLKLPAIYQFREYAVAGGLMSYGISITDGYRQVGIYTGQILKGAKPADLPIHQSIRFEFVINLKTAKALGLDVPPTLSARADEVIE